MTHLRRGSSGQGAAITRVRNALASQPRISLAGLPTPLLEAPRLRDALGGAHACPRILIKRDDLTWLGLGGNKARKLEFLCGAAVAAGARTLVTVGAAQSNHCRMTAAAGALLGLDVHLVLAGDRPDTPTGNQLLSMLFGAHLHFTGAEESHWGELEIASEALTDELRTGGAQPYPIPIVCELLGAPKEDWQLFSRLAADVLRVFNFDLANDLEIIMKAQDELDEYTRELIAERRSKPADDLITDLIAAEEEGGAMAEIVRRRPDLGRRTAKLQAEHASILRSFEHTLAMIPHASLSVLEEIVVELLGALGDHDEAERRLAEDALLQDLGVVD